MAAYQARSSTPEQMEEIHILTPTDAVAFGRWRLVFGNASSEGYFTLQLKKL